MIEYFLSIGPADLLYNSQLIQQSLPDWYAEWYVAYYEPIFRWAEQSDGVCGVLRGYLALWNDPSSMFEEMGRALDQ